MLRSFASRANAKAVGWIRAPYQAPALSTFAEFCANVQDSVEANFPSPEQRNKARARAAAIQTEYDAIQQPFPPQSHGRTHVTKDQAYRKRLIYRSKQRGLLEVDLVLGTWAKHNVMKLPEDELPQYEALLQEETLVIFDYVSGKVPLPSHLDTPVMRRIQAYCASSPFGRVTEGTATRL